jgi:hypothetical protein
MIANPKNIKGLRRDLAGYDLACWCPLDQPCHADVLLELANADDTEATTQKYVAQ